MMASESPFLRLPLELRQQIYDCALPPLLTVRPCAPDLRTPSPPASIFPTKRPCLTYCALPQSCASVASASRDPLIPADPCLSLHLTCRVIHQELCGYRHCHSSAHSLKLAFCSATCMAVYTSRVPACILRRVRRVEMMIYLTGWMLEGVVDIQPVVQTYATRLIPRLQEAWRTIPERKKVMACIEGLRDEGHPVVEPNQAKMKIPVQATTGGDAWAVVVLVVDAMRSEASN